jgi:hypothetical protein
MDGELAALAALEGGGDADLDAELVRLVRLALADALNLGGVQAVDLGAALAAFLREHAVCEDKQPCEFRLEPRVVSILRMTSRTTRRLASAFPPDGLINRLCYEA